ncbi:hypothetical protein [Henriciella sp.]|uniref:hypothetical protein n=1 Tax=Henriciella sp. TaxID=1968823 RepID=UPI0026071902|nr:hypothetical protein [Henriciella sp.]
MSQTLDEAMREACEKVGICVPRNTKPGIWAKSPVVGKAKSNTSGRVLIFDDRQGGVAHNWANGLQEIFKLNGQGRSRLSDKERREIAERQRERQRRQQEQYEAVSRICTAIVQDCEATTHPYLERKGFPNEVGLVHENPLKHFPASNLGESLMRAMPDLGQPLLIVPGRIGKTITTVQFITPEGEKKNILGGKMDGASHRIATGRETWVAEGIATALTLRAALKLLGRSATVLSAFSTANVAKVASEHPGAIIAADHDKPVEQFDGLGTGEYYARRSGHVWAMPPVRGDFNDYQDSDGLRAVALQLRGVSA